MTANSILHIAIFAAIVGLIYAVIRSGAAKKCRHVNHEIDPVPISAYGINAPVDFKCMDCGHQEVMFVPAHVHFTMVEDKKTKGIIHLDDYLATPKFGGGEYNGENYYVGVDLATKPDETAWRCPLCGWVNSVPNGDLLRCDRCRLPLLPSNNTGR